ncbi:MAG: ribonuclease HI [Candidatus Pacebacteria bacterium]|nr:ribonuclease HI [Candidatus Paceibacterota bacterium]
MSDILIYSDGSSKGNPGPGGWGAIVAAHDTVRELGGRAEHTTNNKMELLAAFEALKSIPHDPTISVVIRTDSKYVMSGATMWRWGWLKSDWKTKEGKDVINQDLWKPFSSLLHTWGKQVQWEKVGGHVSIPANERVDDIAQSFAAGEPIKLYSGSRKEYSVDVTSVEVDTERQEKKKEVSGRSKIAAYSYISEVDGTVLTHKTWAECEARVRGKRARFKKAISKDEEGQIIKEFSKR